MPTASEEVRLILDRQIDRILDISGRNPLINLSLREARTRVAIVDELPNQLIQTIQSGKKMSLLPLDEHPMARQGDAGLSRVPDELPFLDSDSEQLDRHTDLFIQTNLEEAKLSSTLKFAERRYRADFEDKGIRTLYLAIGFLQFPRYTGREELNTAPLFLYPVKIDRQILNNKLRYQISDSGLPPIWNQCLDLFLLKQHHLSLPKFPDTEDGGVKPEEYLSIVGKWLEDQELDEVGFSLLRRGRLAFFNPSGTSIIVDMDDDDWADESGAGITDNQSLAKVVLGQLKDSDDYSEEHPPVFDIDSHDIGSRIHTPLPSDSSQLSCIVDVLQGRDIIIEGPPGTGKSQTITNIIAASIDAGMRVLFVTEKHAAQAVVDSRLKGIGLGDYVLQVHSSQTTSRDVLEQIKERIERRRTNNPSKLPGLIERLNATRDHITGYLDALHANTDDGCGRSLYSLIGDLRCLTEKGIELHSIDPSQVPDSFDDIDEAARLLREFRILKTQIPSVVADQWSHLHIPNFDNSMSPRIVQISNLLLHLTLKKELPAPRQSVDAFGFARTKKKLGPIQNFRIMASNSCRRLFKRVLLRLELRRAMACLHESLSLDRKISLITPESISLLYSLRDHCDKIHVWSRMCRIADQLRQLNVPDWTEDVDNPALSYRLSAIHHHISKLMKGCPELAQMSSDRLNQLRSEFRELDADIQILSADRIAYGAHVTRSQLPKGCSGPLKKQMTELSLLNNEIRKTRAHVPLRQLFKRCPKCLIRLKPCMLMDPITVSQVLPQQHDLFDLVIFDEASQIEPAKAFGSLARAKQFVIVGDPKQLPPSTWFRGSGRDDGIDEEEVVGEDAESILEIAARQMPDGSYRSLEWHYRSEHESLINYSNRMFYDEKLVIFATPHSGMQGALGVSHKYVEGAFQSGVNQIEAAAVVDSACAFLLKHAENIKPPSLGIAAMNRKQSDLIDDLLVERCASNRELLEAYEHLNSHASEPVFVKNIERVQGDERDHILISYTYGPPSPGEQGVHQRFGPIVIDENGGWRRLNVLVTRARKSILVFTSMKSSQIIANDNQGSRSKAAFKKYLEYAELDGQIDIASPTGVGEAENEFEASIIRFIESLGYECDAQVGVSKYRIDIGVRVPNLPGYILAVECDGRTYHSSKSARDRDANRQAVLEARGWTFYRVWSTDWFNNPDSAKASLQAAIESRIDAHIHSSSAHQPGSQNNSESVNNEVLWD